MPDDILAMIENQEMERALIDQIDVLLAKGIATELVKSKHAQFHALMVRVGFDAQRDWHEIDIEMTTLDGVYASYITLLSEKIPSHDTAIYTSWLAEWTNILVANRRRGWRHTMLHDYGFEQRDRRQDQERSLFVVRKVAGARLVAQREMRVLSASRDLERDEFDVWMSLVEDAVLTEPTYIIIGGLPYRHFEQWERKRPDRRFIRPVRTVRDLQGVPRGARIWEWLHWKAHTPQHQVDELLVHIEIARRS